MRDDAIDDVGLVLVHGEVEYTSSRHGRYEHLLNSCVGEYHAGMILASDLAYIAGLFDADGCFSIGRKRVNGQAKWLLRAILTNGDLGLCQWVQTTLGYGVCYESRFQQPRPNWMPVHRFQAMAGAGRLTAWLLLPYLRTKLRRAELVAFYPTMPKRGMRTRFKREWYTTAQDLVAQELRALNVRGRAKDSDLIADLQRQSPIPPGAGKEWMAAGYTYLAPTGPERHERAGIWIAGPNTNDPPIPELVA